MSGPPGEHIGQCVGRVIPLGKIPHRLPLWCRLLIAGTAGESCPDLAPIGSPSKFPGQIICSIGYKRGSTPWVENPDSPDEPGVLDAGDVVEGFGVNVDTGFLLSGEVNLPIPRIEIRDWCIFFNAAALVVALVACSGSSDGGGCRFQCDSRSHKSAYCSARLYCACYWNCRLAWY